MTNQMKNWSSGYTLIEQIISIVIIGVIAGTMAMFLSSGSTMFNQLLSRKTITLDNTTGIENFSQESRLIYNLISTAAKSIQFTTTSDPLLVINYEINSDGTLTRKLGSGNKYLVAQNIDYDNSYFNYYDINDNVGTPVRRIRLSLLFSLNNDSSRYTVDISPYTFRTVYDDDDDDYEVWDAYGSYVQGQIVSHNGSLWECLQTHQCYGDPNWAPGIAPSLWIPF